MSIPLNKTPVLKCQFQKSGNQITLLYKAHLLSHGFVHFIFFSFNQKFLGSLNQGVLGAGKKSCQIAVHSLTTAAWQSSAIVFHSEKQYTGSRKWTP